MDKDFVQAVSSPTNPLRNHLGAASPRENKRQTLIGLLMSGSGYKWQELVDISGDANLVDEVIGMLRSGGHITNRDSTGRYPVAIWERTK